MTNLRRWVALDDEKKTAAALEKKAKREIAELEPGILEQMAQEGTPKITVELEALDVDGDAADLIAEAVRTSKAPSTEDMALEIVAAMRQASLLKENRPAITKSVFIGSRVWAKPVATGTDDDGEPKATDDDYERACRALEAHGFGEYVQERFNIISLSSALKEEVEHGAIVIPDGADEVVVYDGTIVVSEKPQLNARKAAAKR